MPTNPRRKTYRHGNVQPEAISAASRLIAKSGHDALSLRQVADAVGVAHRSLYNHFKDREALLDAVATEAFARLGQMLKAAKTKEDYTATYVRFALANRHLYRLMTSRPHATMKFNPPLQTAVPYPVFAFCGLWVWNFFASSLRFSVTSLTSNANLVSKVYFPREIFPFSAVIVCLVELAVGCVVVVGLVSC